MKYLHLLSLSNCRSFSTFPFAWLPSEFMVAGTWFTFFARSILSMKSPGNGIFGCGHTELLKFSFDFSYGNSSIWPHTIPQKERPEQGLWTTKAHLQLKQKLITVIKFSSSSYSNLIDHIQIQHTMHRSVHTFTRTSRPQRDSCDGIDPGQELGDARETTGIYGIAAYG